MSSPLQNTCIACGQAIGSSIAGTQCLQCLLKLAVDDQDESQPSIVDGHAGSGFLKHGVIPEFDDYELIEEIARGGMGVVYRARQVSLNRTVAIKLILAGQLATPESIERFQQEARAAAHLDHPGIVPVYKVGEYQGQHFISMKLIDGDNLDRQLKRYALNQDMPPAELRSRQTKMATLVSRIARAIQYAHDHGVLHRDIKPHNVLVDNDGNPHVTDFGLAKLTGHEQTGLTLTDAILGSPSYMAPEQAAGDTAEITVQTDVYGIGALLYEMLAARPPFLGRSVLETMKQLAEQPPRPPRSFIRGVHPDLETIALKCLEKKCVHRYSSAGLLADELDRFCMGQPIQARPVGMVVSMWRWCARHKAVSSLLAMILLAVITGFVAVTWQWRRAEQINVQLQQSLDRQRWIDVVEMVDRDENSNALAYLAQRLRDDPTDWRAAMMATSILDHRRFAVPAFEPVSHGGNVQINNIQFGPDGRHFGTAGTDGTAIVWDAATGSEEFRLKHTANVTWLEFASSRPLVVTASLDRSAKIWAFETGEQLATLEHPDAVHMGLFCHQDSKVVTACRDGCVRIWDLQSAAQISTVSLESEVLAISLGPNNQCVAGCADGTIHVLDVAAVDTSKMLGRYEVKGRVERVFCSHDGRFVIAASNSQVQCWNVDTGEKVFTGAAHPQYTPALSWTRNLAVVTAGGRAVQIMDLETGRPVVDRIAAKYSVFAAAFDRTDHEFASGGWDYELAIRDVDSGMLKVSPIRLPAPPLQAQFSPDNQHLLIQFGSVQYVTDSPSEKVSVGIWDLYRSSGTLRFRPPDDRKTFAGAVNQQGNRVAICESSKVHLMDREFQRLAEFEVGPGSRSLAFTPDGKRIVVGMTRGEFTVWNIETGQCLVGPILTGASAYCYRLSPDGGLLAVEDDGRVELWEIDTGQQVGDLSHGGTLNDVTFSPDGRLLASATDNHTAKIWDVATHRCLQTLQHDFRVEACKFSPDSQKLVTGSNDFTAKIWDVETGQQIGATMQHQGEVGNAEFSADGSRILTSARDGTACIWDATTGKPTVSMMIHDSALREANISPDGRVAVTIDHDALRVWDMQSGLPVGVKVRMKSVTGIGHDSMGERAAFLPDSSHILWTMGVPESQLCSTEAPPLPVPDWFPDLLESVGGMFLNDADMLTRQSVSEQLNVRRQWSQTPPAGEAYYGQRLLRWLNIGSHSDPMRVPDRANAAAK